MKKEGKHSPICHIACISYCPRAASAAPLGKMPIENGEKLMAFQIRNTTGYSASLAQDALGHEIVYLVGLTLETQYEYADNKRTDNITGYQVWVATDNHNPFKVKFAVEDQPNLSTLKIGDAVNFEGLEAVQIKSNVYFRAKKLMKG